MHPTPMSAAQTKPVRAPLSGSEEPQPSSAPAWCSTYELLVVFGRLVIEWFGIVQRTNTGASGMIGDLHDHFARVVGVIRFLELVTESSHRVFESRTVALLVRRIWRVDGDPQDVVSSGDRRLAVATIENEVLTAQEKAVGIGPAVADSLVSGDANATAAQVEIGSWRLHVIQDRL